MIELFLVLGACTAAVALSVYLVRWVLARPLDREMVDLANAARSAAESFTRTQGRTVLALSALFAGVLFLGYGLKSEAGETPSTLELGVFLTASFVAGALAVALVGQIGTFTATRTAVRAATAARKSVDQALVVSVRGGAVTGLLTHAVSAFGYALLIVAIHLYYTQLRGTASLVVSPKLPLALLGFPLGATFAGLLVQISGGLFAKGSDVGADLGGREVDLDEDARENPGALANLAGDLVGAGSTKPALFLATIAAEDLAFMFAGAAIYVANPTLPSALSLVALPLLARAFGVLGAAFAVMIVRTDEHEDPQSALARGYVVSAVLHAVGFVGAAKWLLPDQWLRIVLAAAIGLFAGLVLFFASAQVLSQRSASMRDIAEGSRVGPAITLLRGLTLGADLSLLPIILFVASTTLGYYVGAGTGLAAGGLFGVALVGMGFLGSAPFVLSLDLAAGVTDAARAMVEMTIGRERRDVRGRLVLLDAVGDGQEAFARSFLLVGAAISIWLIVRPAMPEEAASGVASAHPILVGSAVLLVAFMTWFIARALVATQRIARRIVDEIRRQRGGRRPSAPEVEQTPCVDIAARLSMRHTSGSAIVTLVVPLALLAVVRAAGGPAIFSDAVSIALVATTLTCLLGATMFGAAAAAWAGSRKHLLSGPRGGRHAENEQGEVIESPAYLATLTGDTVGDLAKDVALPIALALVKFFPLLVLASLPFFR